MKKMLLIGIVLSNIVFSNVALAGTAPGFPSVAVNCFQGEGLVLKNTSGIEVFVRKLGDEKSRPIICGKRSSKLNNARYMIDKVKVPDIDKTSAQVDIVENCHINIASAEPVTVNIYERAGGYTCRMNYGRK